VRHIKHSNNVRQLQTAACLNNRNIKFVCIVVKTYGKAYTYKMCLNSLTEKFITTTTNDTLIKKKTELSQYALGEVGQGKLSFISNCLAIGFSFDLASIQL